MSEPLFDIEPEPPQSEPAPAGPALALTEREMLDLLHQRFGFTSRNGGVPKPRYVCAEHVRAESGFDQRTLDFIAVDTWRSGNLAIHGAEVKVSRSDWLRELKDPHKSEPFLAWTTHFWLAVPDAAIVRDGELPPGWGLLAARATRAGAQLVARVTAPRRAVSPPPPESIASLLYAAAKTAHIRGYREGYRAS